jgi:putative MATE family efflux protein
MIDEVGADGAITMKPAVLPHVASSDDKAVIPDRKAIARTAMLTAPILPTVLKLALPTVTVLIAQTLVGIAESYYVGFLGTSALAGVALVFPGWMLMTMMSNGGLGSGVSSAVARAIGAGRQADADALILHAIVLAVLAGLIFSAATFWLGPLLYRALGGDGAALDAAVTYSNYIFAGSVPIWIVNLIAAALRGSGNVRVPALVILVGTIVLIPASPALIFGFGPIPRLGIAGAGIAVGIYHVAAALVLLRYMASGRSGLTLRLAPLQPRLFGDILRVGLMVAISAVQSNLTVIIVTGAVGLFGIHALAGYGIASRLDYIMIPLLFGIGTAVLTMVGVNIGAGNLARAKRIAWIGGLMGAGLTETIGLLAALFPSAWLHLFSNDAAVLAPAATYLHIVAPAYGALGLGFVLSFAAQGAGHVLWPFLGGTTRMLISAGLGWLAVAQFHASMSALSAIVAAATVGFALICATATLSGAIWRSARA